MDCVSPEKVYISHFAVFYIDLDQEDLYDGDVQRMTGDSRSVGLVVSSDNSFYFVCVCRYMFLYIFKAEEYR